jgi:hypothetical protein
MVSYGWCTGMENWTSCWGFCGVEVLWRLALERVLDSDVVTELNLGLGIVSLTVRGSKVVVVYEVAGDGGLVSGLALSLRSFAAHNGIRGRAWTCMDVHDEGAGEALRP